MAKLTKDQKRKNKLKLRQKNKASNILDKNSSPQSQEVITITDSFLNSVKNWPVPIGNYDCVPFIVDYYDKEMSEDIKDLEFIVAKGFIMYGHWYTTGSKSIALSELTIASEAIMKSSEFQEKLASRVIA